MSTTVNHYPAVNTSPPTYPVMDIREFGAALISTQDLDPVYTALYGLTPRPQLARLLLAYWMFYHLGAAAWLSEHEGADYWHWVLEAAANQSSPPPYELARWPRSAERRHFRGYKAIRAADSLKNHFPQPEDAVASLLGPTGSTTAPGVMARVQAWPMFGPWVAFKAADMLERVWGASIQFEARIGLMYSEPASALDMLMVPGQPGRPISTATSPEQWWSMLLEHFSSRRAPPSWDRPCGPQEVETILCKWKGHARGTYRVGKDIREVRHGLVGWGRTAERLLRAAPEEVV